MTDLGAVGGAPPPTAVRRLPLGSWQRGLVDRVERIDAEIVLDVGDQQLLVLLLMVQSQLGARGNYRPVGRGAVRNECHHRRVDVGPIGHHLGDRRPRQQATPGPRIDLSDLLIVRVEEELECLAERLVAGGERLQHEGLEEPADVGQVPLRRAGEHGTLDQVVLDRERRTELLATAAHRPVTGQPGPSIRHLRVRVERAAAHLQSLPVTTRMHGHVPGSVARGPAPAPMKTFQPA